jgi:hypothetical protein
MPLLISDLHHGVPKYSDHYRLWFCICSLEREGL